MDTIRRVLDDQWIPVGERLPQWEIDVLVYTSKGLYDIAAISTFSKWYSRSMIIDDVTHWQPLPEPPA